MAITYSVTDPNNQFALDADGQTLKRVGAVTAGNSYQITATRTDTTTGEAYSKKFMIAVTAAIMSITGVNGDGDSIMRGFNLANPATQNMLAQFSSLSGLPVYNGGSDGDTLANINSTWASSGNAARYNASSLNAYLLEGGGADLRAGASAATCRTNNQAIISQSKAALYISGVSTVLPQGTASAGWTAAAETERLSYNAWLRANWQTYADWFVDFANIPEAQDPNNTAYYSDGIHPTAALATILGQAIKAAVAAINSAGSTQTATLSVSEAFDTATISGSSAGGGQTATLAATEARDTTAVSASASGGASPTVQWSATDKDPSVAKTSATRTDRATTAGSTNGTIRSDTSKTSGRRYVEWKVEAVSSNNQGLLVGFALSTEPVSNYLGQSNKSVGMWSSGSQVLYSAGPTNTGFGNFVVGDIIGGDLDIGAGTVRFAKNNVWSPTVNVAAMTTAGPVFVAATMLNVTPLTGTTANFGDSAFVYTPPTGATAWNA